MSGHPLRSPTIADIDPDSFLPKPQCERAVAPLEILLRRQYSLLTSGYTTDVREIVVLYSRLTSLWIS